MKIDLQTFWLLLYCFSKDVPFGQTVNLSGLSQKAVTHWYNLFLLHIPEMYGDDEPLSGNIQMDEAYFGRFDKSICLLMAKQIYFIFEYKTSI